MDVRNLRSKQKIHTICCHIMRGWDGTQRQLAFEMNIHESILSRLLSSRSEGTSRENVARIMKYLGFSGFERDWRTLNLLMDIYIKDNKLKC